MTVNNKFVHDNYETTIKQDATNENSAAARMDRATEDRIYQLYRNFFRDAEERRRWNVWEDFDWQGVNTNPSEELVQAVTRIYHNELFLPDYTQKGLHLLRASRGRAWFITRWSYEEGKHILALTEWMTHSGAYSDKQLQEQSDTLLNRFIWEPPYSDAPAVIADFYLWELRENRSYEALMRLARSEEDTVLVSVLDRIIRDENAHLEFMRETLRILSEADSEKVIDAVRRVVEADSEEGEGQEVQQLREEFGLSDEGSL